MSDHVSIERMNEALDAALTAAELSVLQAHVRECDVCRHEYARLSEVVGAVRALPRSADPPAEVWTEIAARITGRSGVSETDGPWVLPLPTGAPHAGSRRITASVPQLAAAALVVSLLSATIVWLAIRGVPGEVQVAAPEQGIAPTLVGAATRAVSADGRRYGEVVVELEQILQGGSSVLTPETLITIEASLTTVDGAIADVEAALADDPGSDLLMRMLSNYQRTKLGVLQRAVAAVHAQT